MKRIHFHNDTESTELELEGRVIFDLLQDDDIAELKGLFERYHSEQPEGFYATTHAEDKAWRKLVSDDILEIIGKRIEPLFENIQLLGGAFISKAPGEKGILPLHQDWNIVDERKARSYNLWIPLVDVNEFNGAMRILPQSHQKQETYRGPNIPPVLHAISKEVDEHMESLNMTAGQGLLYDHALWHSSPINQSNELRLAVVFGVIPQGAEMVFYHRQGEMVETYASHPEFFFQNDPKEGPKGLKKMDSILFNTNALSLEQFEAIYLGNQPAPGKKSWWSFLKKQNA